MSLTAKAALAGIAAMALLLAGEKDLGLIALGVFLGLAAPWYVEIGRQLLGFPASLDL